MNRFGSLLFLGMSTDFSTRVPPALARFAAAVFMRPEPDNRRSTQLSARRKPTYDARRLSVPLQVTIGAPYVAGRIVICG